MGTVSSAFFGFVLFLLACFLFSSRVNHPHKPALVDRETRCVERMVKSYAQTICLKDDPEGIAEYKRYHANSWPEVLEALKAVGILRMKIFLLGMDFWKGRDRMGLFGPKGGRAGRRGKTPQACDVKESARAQPYPTRVTPPSTSCRQRALSLFVSVGEQEREQAHSLIAI